MIAIGIGNLKGGVGSTTLCWQLAALIRRSGASVAIANTSREPSAYDWYVPKINKDSGVTMPGKSPLGYFRASHYSELCDLTDRGGFDYLLVDCTHVRQDLDEALCYVQHWLCPLGAIEYRPTIALYRRWLEARDLGFDAARTFCAVFNQMPNPEDVAADPGLATSLFQGDFATEIFGTHTPTMKVLQRRLKTNVAFGDTEDGHDVFSLTGPEAVEGRSDIAAIWIELLQHWHLKSGAAGPSRGIKAPLPAFDRWPHLTDLRQHESKLRRQLDLRH